MTYYDHATGLALGLEPWGRTAASHHPSPPPHTAPRTRRFGWRILRFRRLFPVH